ncbi:efflux RND transporter permease subunit [Mangrovicoccus sp. HB161399]|uniref:efflux RND transporter permease subunit n=1 Tax=Mangrovicoccus sp. HB161399 TaxID=2720392 RepID=UPI0015520E30|nr:efflux RND transporter permease subunit [Mangrovicoccus sp. HB161399]
MAPERSGILAYFAGHRTAASFVMIVMLALGLMSVSQIRSQFFPDVAVDTVNVTVKWDGAGPGELDRGVVALLDPALRSVEGVTGSAAVSTDGSATITLAMEPGRDLGRATEEVKAAVDGVTTLPAGAEAPVVKAAIWKDKVTEVVIHAPIAPDQLARLGDDFLARLWRAGLTRSTVTGIAAPRIELSVPAEARLRHDIQLGEIADAVARAAETRPAGNVAGGTARLRAGEETRDPEALRDLVVRVNPDGSKLRLRNLAQIAEAGSDAGRAYSFGGDPAVLIRVDRTEGGDAIGMEATVRQLAEEMRAEMPPGGDVVLINARARDITAQLNLLYENGLAGLVLVLITLFLFLSARTAFWVAMGIPVSMLAAVAVMQAGGLTLNMMSLFGLIITLGIIVDDAIVVAEHSDWRARHLGESPALAPVRAVRRMAGPVAASTATTVLAFVALWFIGGEFGSLISDIPFVVTAVLAASLVESFLILPNHMRHALEHGRKDSWIDRPSQWFNRNFERANAALFVPLMRWIIRLRYPFAAAMLLLLSVSGAALLRGDVPWAFYTAPERPSVTGNFAFLPGATRADSAAFAAELERAAAAAGEKLAGPDGTPPLVHVLSEVGGTGAKGLPGEDTMDPDTLGSVDIGLIGADHRNFTAQDLVRALNAEIRLPPNLAVLSFRSQGLGPGGDSLSVNFHGEDAFALKAAATELIAELRGYPEVTGLQDSLPWGRDDMVLRLTPVGEALGFTTDGIGAELFGRLNGITAAEFPAGSRTAEIVVQVPGAELTAGFLEDTLMRAPSGAWVPLGELVSIESHPAFASIAREDGRQLVTVTGALSEDDPVRAAEIAAALRGDILPRIAQAHGLGWDLGGLAVQEDDFLGEAMTGFLLCVLGIYLVLGWVFGSWSAPLVVMAVIPFGLIGAVWGHAQFGLAFSLFTLIGLIGMSGIIINDAIVLVTTVQDHARRMPVAAAAVRAAGERLRPILLTTLTTVLGLAPLMFEESRTSLFLKPTVVTLVWGLSAGFFIVLALVPALLVIRTDAARALASLRRMLRAGGRAGRLPLLLGTAVAAMAALDLVLLWPWIAAGAAPGLPLMAAAAGNAAILLPAAILLQRRRAAR